MINERKKDRIKRIFTMIFMRFYRGGHKRAEYLKRKNIFKSFGDNCYWFPRKLPAEPGIITIHNNVNIATDVYFCDHDVIHHMLNNVPEYVDQLPSGVYYSYRTSGIEIMDNVFIGAHSIIMGGIKIESNVIIAAGSVVTKDVPKNSVFGGNPAKYICDIDCYLKKRTKVSKNEGIHNES